MPYWKWKAEWLWERLIPHMMSPGKDANSEIEVWFLLNVYHFCTIVMLKDCKLNHSKKPPAFVNTTCVSLLNPPYKVAPDQCLKIFSYPLVALFSWVERIVGLITNLLLLCHSFIRLSHFPPSPPPTNWKKPETLSKWNLRFLCSFSGFTQSLTLRKLSK